MNVMPNKSPQYTTSKVAELIGVHANTIRNLKSKYGDYIPHSTVKGVAYYDDDSIERINEIRDYIDKGVSGDKLLNELAVKYGVVQHNESPTPQPTKQQSQSNDPTTALTETVSNADLLNSESFVQLQRNMNQLLHTQNEHNNQLESKQQIIDDKNNEIDELQRELTATKSKVNRLEGKITRLSFFGWRANK